MKKVVFAGTILALTGCASLTPTREQVEGYRVYNIQAAPSSSTTFQIAASLKKAMQGNAKGVRFENTLPPSTLPEKPARFELTNPLKGSNLAALAGNLRVPHCEGSVIEATSHDSFAGAESTTFFVCLMPYSAGYSMNIYYTYTKVSGGIGADALGRALAQEIIGDSSQFIPRTIRALENAASTGGRIKLVDAYPAAPS